jgi:O-antigen ligase
MAFVAVALGARGGSGLERTAIVELALIVAGALLVGAAVLRAPAGRVPGAVAVGAFGALAAITALSIAWSTAPDLSYVETGRTLAYLATFTGAVALARLAPGGAETVTRGVLLGAVAICAYGLATRVWPASFDELAFTGRVGQPFDYWNALAGVAALGLLPALWLGTSRNTSSLGRALTFPACGLLLATLLITQSRGALAAAAIGCTVWLIVVPRRLRSLVVLGVSALGAAPVVRWALDQDTFELGRLPLAAREAVAGDFGLLLAAMLVVLLLAGIATEAVAARRAPSLQTRFRFGLVAVVVAALVPLALVTAVAISDRGLTGTISDRFDELTDDSAAPPTGGGRLGSLASERFGYWHEALDAFGEQPLEGLGAGSFELARLAHRNDDGNARRAHGFPPQTLSDLGLLGGLAALALLAAWLAAAARATGLQPRRWWTAPARPRPPWTSERAALVALALTTVIYGIQATTDWTWFVPGLTVMALVTAGFVAGRGPSGRASDATHAPAPGLPSPARLLLLTALAPLALLVCWAVWQPVASDRAVVRSYDLLSAGDPVGALREASDARDINPYSVEALYAAASAFDNLDRRDATIAALRRAADDRPRDPEPWLRLAVLRLALDEPNIALAAAQRALTLDPQSAAALSLRDQAAALVTRQTVAKPDPAGP